jgi:hypothetical protein
MNTFATLRHVGFVLCMDVSPAPEHRDDVKIAFQYLPLEFLKKLSILISTARGVCIYRFPSQFITGKR